MPGDRVLDKSEVRRSFDRAASTYDGAAVLQREVADRMLARLEYLKVDPRLILDAGSGTGYAASRLRARYRDARVIELDLAPAMLAQSAKGESAWSRGLARLGMTRTARVCADIERLPIASARVDMLWSNLALQWVDGLDAAFAELWRVLRPGGVVLFTTFGPDTLRELRAAFAAADAREHVNRFIDMHDIGDLLVHARFADPVMDMEQITMTYPDARSVMRDLKRIGAHNAARARARGLTGRGVLARVESAYERFRREGCLPATFEVVYGHAWKPLAPRVAADGRAVVRFSPRKP